jgi:hypothetical protein
MVTRYVLETCALTFEYYMLTFSLTKHFQFYIISEKDLVEHMQSIEAHDYGSQADDVPITIDVQESFSGWTCGAPDLSNQVRLGYVCFHLVCCMLTFSLPEHKSSTCCES